MVDFKAQLAREMTIDEFTASLERYDVDELTQKYADEQRSFKRSEERKKAIGSVLINAVLTDPRMEITDEGNASYKNDLGTTSVMRRETKTINRTMLIARGVDPTLIDECTTTSESEPYVVFYPKKAKT